MMDGGNSVSLNLEAALDTSTSDMLVPVNNNTWQHNWQKYQGKYLPNSLRFEANGWAADWNVFDLKYNNIRYKIRDDLVANCVILDTGRYMTCLYNTQFSADVLDTLQFTVDSEILSVDRGTATFNNDNIQYSFSNLSGTILFNKHTHELSVSNNNVILDYAVLDNNVFDICLVNAREYKRIDVSFLKHTVATCSQLLNDLPYDGYDGTWHSWGENKIKFNGSTLQVNNVNTQVTRDSNTLTFSFNETQNLNFSLTMQFVDYISGYNSLHLESGTWSDSIPLVYDAQADYDINRITGVFSDINVSNDFGMSYITVPFWYSLTIELGNIDKSLGALKPDNAGGADTDFITFESPIYYGLEFRPDTINTFKAKSVFSDSVITSSYEYINILIRDRYNEIALGNSITWKYFNRTGTANAGNVYKYVAQEGTQYYGWVKGFSKIRNGDDIATACKFWGLKASKYTYNSFMYSPGTSIGIPGWMLDSTLSKQVLQDPGDIERFNSITDYDNMIAAPVDIEQWSIGGQFNGTYDEHGMQIPDIGEIPTAGELGYAFEILKNRKCIGIVPNDTTLGTAYSENDAYHTAAEIYGVVPVLANVGTSYTNQGYLLNTYKRVTPNMLPSSEYFPFADVPCFNYVGSAATNDVGVTKKGIYAVYVSNGQTHYVTAFDEFRTLVFGTFSAASSDFASPIQYNPDYKGRTRVVLKVAEPLFDFTKDNSEQFKHNWKKWYPGVQCPTELNGDSVLFEDHTYEDYNDVEIVNVECKTYEEWQEYTDKVTRAHRIIEDSSYPDYNPDNFEAKMLIEQDVAKKTAYDQAIVISKFERPGVVLIYSHTENPGIGIRLSLSCFNELGIVPWKDGASLETISNITYRRFPTVTQHDDIICKRVYQKHSGIGTKTHSIYSSALARLTLTDPWHSAVGNVGLPSLLQFSINKAIDSFNDKTLSVIVQNPNLSYWRLSFAEHAENVSFSSGGIEGEIVDGEYGTYTIEPNSVLSYSVPANIRRCFLREPKLCFEDQSFAVISTCYKGYLPFNLRYSRFATKQEMSRYVLDNNTHNISGIPLEVGTVSDIQWFIAHNMRGCTRLDSVGIFNLCIDDFDPLTEGQGSLRLRVQTLDDEPVLFAPEGSDLDKLYPNIASCVNGGLSEVDTDELGAGKLYLIGDAIDTVKIPFTGELRAHPISTNNLNHIFYKRGIVKVNRNELTDVTEITNNLHVPVTLTFNICETNVPVVYNPDTQTVSISSVTVATGEHANISFSNTSMSVAFEYDTDEVFNDAFTVPVTLQYNQMTCAYPSVATTGYSFTQCTDEVYTIQHDGTQFRYNIALNKVLDSNASLASDILDNSVRLRLILGDQQHILAKFNYLDDDNLYMTFRGEDVTIDTSVFFNGDNDLMSIEAVDVRDTEHTKYIGETNAADEFQLIKQQWNSTSEVENYWWINKTHILELNKHDFVYKRNTKELDDWNGNRWEDIYKVSRYVIGTGRMHYTVPSVYRSEQTAPLITIKESGDRLVVSFYDTENKLEFIDSIEITVNNKALGTVLNSNTYSSKLAIFNTYSSLTVNEILSQAKWTSTIRGNDLIIGCHVNNNFDQWAIVVNLDSFNIVGCIQGYGFVGVDGSLTGGQIPGKYFTSTLGFNSKVDSLDTLSKIDDLTDKDDIDAPYVVNDTADINRVTERVVGTAERQYYICKKLDNIVSHLTYNSVNHAFEIKTLPITSVYDAIYKSPSFMSEVVYDNKILVKSLRSLFSGVSGSMSAVWNTFVSAALDPDIFLYAPKLASIVYLQQTFGQYAYVHYNSTRAPELKENEDSTDLSKDRSTKGNIAEDNAKEPLLSDELTFDKQVVRQSGLRPYNEQKNSLLFLFNVFLPAIKALDNKLAVNEGVTATTVSDTCKVFEQSATENISELMTKALKTDAPTTALNSSVVGIRSLDMFYSTSDGQRVFAGPGFVEHQFVADCIAQSYTEVQMSCYVEQLSFVIKVLSVWKLKLAQMLTDFAIEALQKSADWAANTTVSVLGSGTNAAGVAAALIALVGITAAQTAARSIRVAQSEVESLIDALASQMKADNTDSAVRQKADVEAKHKYGEKNEYFMWPCFGIPEGGIEYNDETVVACAKESTWSLDMTTNKVTDGNGSNVVITDPRQHRIAHSTLDVSSTQSIAFVLKGDVPLYTASCYGKTEVRYLPEKMAKVEGVAGFLPTQAFKNKNIGLSDPAFTPSLFQDYMIDEQWQLSRCATYGLTQWITCKDTQLINCDASNMIITDDFCGIAAPYTAIEIKRGLSKEYMRPWAITPNVLALNCTGYNTILDDNMYHSFDGISYRIVDWTGTAGMNKNNQTFLYCFQLNDRFKRSNKFPANELQGNFDGDPNICVNTIDKVFTLVTNATKQKGIEGGTIGEDKDATRWAIPIFTEQVSIMPAAVKTLTAMLLNVFDGITALTTNAMNNQVAYKAPISIDFIIGKNVYRYTKDYICQVQTEKGIDFVFELVPAIGLTYLGATLTEAYFYCKANRCLYAYTGGTALNRLDMLERFRDIKNGAFDLVNQNVVMPCLITYSRLNKDIKDIDTETDNIIVPILSQGKVSGELPVPITTIFNDRSWYKCLSLPSGFVYQGPNRVIINRDIFTDYMLNSIKSNIGKWQKLNKEKYTIERQYKEKYTDIGTEVTGVKGWTYNPFVLVTSPLGVAEDADCVFEWTITFCWPVEMDQIYGPDNYAVVNIAAETMSVGGKVTARPTHVYLTKELFTRTGNYGYYSFTYQSKNGMGNRERLHIWCDQYIAISSIACEYKVVTKKKATQLTQQVDVQKLKEL